MSTPANNSDGTSDEGSVELVTFPIVDTDNVALSRLLDQQGLTFQSIPVVDINGQPITIDSHIQVSASGIATLPANNGSSLPRTEEQTSDSPSDAVSKSGGQTGRYPVTDNLSAVFSEGVQVNIVPPQGALSSSSCMLELTEDPYNPGAESAFPGDESEKEDCLLQGDNSLNNNELQKPCSDEIFTNIQAFLSESILNAIINTKSTFLDLQSRNGLNWNEDVSAWCVSGKLTELLSLQHKFLNLLKGNPQEVQGYPSTCDKCVQTDSPTYSDFSSMCDILVPAVSTYGRGIRQPARFNQYSFVAEAEDSYGNEDRPKRSRRKRKTDNSEVVPDDTPSLLTNSTGQNDTSAEKINYLMSGGTSKSVLSAEVDEGQIQESEKCDTKLDFSEGNKLDQQPTRQQEVRTKGSSDEFARIPRKKTRKDYENLAPFKYFCKICSFKSKRESHFTKHMKLHTNNTELYQCKHCDFKTIRPSTLKCHEVCHSKSLFYCDHCKYRTTNSFLLMKHIKVKHRPPSDKGQQSRNAQYFHCQHCSYKTVRAQKFAQHLETHGTTLLPEDTEKLKLLHKSDDSGTVELKCDDCNYMTTRKEHLARHKNNVHCDVRPFLCDLCGWSFKRADTLTAHKVTHIDKKYRTYRYKCKECQKDFRSKAHLSEHMAMHSSLRSYLCDICGVGFKRKSCQQKHMKSIHLNPRSFQCTACHKSFNTKYALLRHTRTHDTSLPFQVGSDSQVPLQQIQIFQCSECQKPFNTKYSLLQHMRTDHPTIQIPEEEEPESLPQMEAQIATFQTLDGQTLDTQTLDGQTQELRVEDIITGGQVLEEYDPQGNLPGNETAIATIYLTNTLPLNI